MRARSAAAVPRACSVFTCAMRGPASTVIQPGSASKSSGVSPVSSPTSRTTLRARSTRSPSTSFRVRQPGRKIDSSRIRGVCAHHTENEAAVAAAQRSHGKTVLYAWVRQIPLAPRQHAGEIGLEIRPMKHRSPDGMPVQHQHAAVPERRVRPPQRVEMRRNLVPPLVRERPRPRSTGPVRAARRVRSSSRSCAVPKRVRQTWRQRPSRGDHASIVPSVTTTASPPIEAERTRPASTTATSRIRLGRPIS